MGGSPFGVADAGEFEAVFGFAVVGRGAHAADGGEVLDVEVGGDVLVGDVEGDDFGDDEVVIADAGEGVEDAFEAGFGFGDAGDFDVGARCSVETGGGEFIHAFGEFGGGGVHGFHEFFGDEVNDEFLCGGDVFGGVLGLAGRFIADADGDEGRAAADHVEEAEGGKVDDAGRVLGGDPGDGARDDDVGEDAVSAAGVEFGEVEVHVYFALG